MKTFAEFAIDIAKSRGVEYADVRVVIDDLEDIQTRNALVTKLRTEQSMGLGIRVLFRGAWGFASSNHLEKNDVEETVKRAFEAAEASSRAGRQHFQFAPELVHEAKWIMPVLQDPFEVKLEDKLSLLEKIYRACSVVKAVSIVTGNMSFQRRHQYFVNSEGSHIEQTTYLSGIGYTVLASDGKEMQSRSFPAAMGGQRAAMGYELIYEWPLLEKAEQISEEAVALLHAAECPRKRTDLILGGSQLALQIHETCGHPVELDRVLGHEADFAGTSFMTLASRGNLRYGSELVNLFADARPQSTAGAGTFAYDDEGVPAQRTELVKDGVLVDFLFSRETAAILGASRSNGCMRASSWNRSPIIRMTNVSLEPGEWKLDDLIADTNDGLFMETTRSWSIDDRRYNFQFGTEIAWEIKNGKKVRILKNPTYGGLTTDFWHSCDAICDDSAWILWGIPNCSKGQPEQNITTSHGTSPARFRNVEVGVGHAQ